MDYNEFRKLLTNNETNATCVWWFNVDIDNSWDENQEGFFPVIESGGKTIIYGMEQILLMIATSNDYVIFRNQPESIILQNIRLIGKKLPQILVLSENDENKSISELIISDTKIISLMKNLSCRHSVYLVPYAISVFEERIARLTGAHMIGPTLSLACWINSKINARRIATELNLPTTEGFECHTFEELKNSIELLYDSPNNVNLVLKDAYGSSGKGLFRIKSNDDIRLIEYQAKKKLKKNKNFNVLLEKWCDVKYNINYQFYIADNNVVTLNTSYQKIENGVYCGSCFINNKDKLNILIKGFSKKIGNYLYNKGYRGLCNIDSIILDDETLIPIIEINGRFSLSTYISCLSFIKEKIIRSYYFDISNKIRIETLNLYLKNSNHQYDDESQTGTIIYSFSYGEKNNRVFFLDVSNLEEIDNITEKSIIEMINRIESNNY